MDSEIKDVCNLYLSIRFLKMEIRNDPAFLYAAFYAKHKNKIDNGKINKNELFYSCLSASYDISLERDKVFDFIFKASQKAEIAIIGGSDPWSIVNSQSDLIMNAISVTLCDPNPGKLFHAAKIMLNDHALCDDMMKMAKETDLFFDYEIKPFPGIIETHM